MNKRKIKIYPILTLVLLFFLWYITATIVNIEIIIPKPNIVFEDLINNLTKCEFYKSLFFTFMRVIIVFAIALLMAIIFALLANSSAAIEKLFYPLVIIMRATPTMSIILLCLIWLNNRISPYVVAFIVVFPLCYVAILSSIKNLDVEILEMTKVFNIPKKRVIKDYMFWAVCDNVFEDTVSKLSLTVKIIIAGEALSETPYSMGKMMQQSKVYLDTADLFALTIIAIVLSFLLEIVLKKIYKSIRNHD